MNRTQMEMDAEGVSAAVRRKETIVVALDGSPGSLAALPVAKSLAEIVSSTVHVVYVGGHGVPAKVIAEKLGLSPEQLHGLVIEHTTGNPPVEIAHIASERESIFIVMCTHTGEPKPDGKLGSVAEGVLYEAKVPVVLVRPERGLKEWKLRRILLPHDGTTTTGAATGMAAHLAHLANAELIVLHIAIQTEAAHSFGAPQYVDQPQHEWPAWANEFLSRLHSQGHSLSELKLRLFLARGKPGQVIVHSAQEHNADLIVLAWRGHLEAERAGIIKDCMRNAPCPLLIVRVE